MASAPPGPGDGEPGESASIPSHPAPPISPPPAAFPPSPAAPPAEPRPASGPSGGASAESVPRTTRDAAAWLLIAALGFLAGQLASAVLLTVVAAASGHLSDVSKLAARTEPPAWVVGSELVGLWAGFVGAAVLASRVRGSGSLRRDMGLEVRGWDLLIGPVVGLAGQLLLLPVLYFPLRRVIPHLDDRLRQPAKHLTGGFPGADLAVVALLTVVVVPVVEELFFRGLVQRALVRVFRRAGHVVGPVLAVVSTGVVFGLAHFELLELLGLATFGVVLAVMAYRFRRLGPCILAHATFNLVAIVSVAFPTGLVHGV